MNTPSSFRLPFVLTLLLFFFGASSTAWSAQGPAPAIPDPEEQAVRSAIHSLTQLRGVTESLRNDAREKFKNSPKKLLKADLLYESAQGMGNAYVEALQSAIGRRKYEVWFDREAQGVTDAVDRLARYVGSAPPPGAAESTGRLVEDALSLWKTYKDQEGAIIDEVVAELDKLRWKKWQETAPAP